MAWRSCPWTSTAAATAPRPSGPACPASHSPPVPGARAGATRGPRRAGPAPSRPPALPLPATAAPGLPPPSELERLGDSYAILSLDARRQVIELFRPALDRPGAGTAAR